MSNQKITLSCGISVDFTGKLDTPFNYIGSFADMLKRYKASKNPDIRNIAIIEIENRAIKHAHEALAGYNMRARMADEAVKLLMQKIKEELSSN